MEAPVVLVVGDVNPDLLLTGDVAPDFGQTEKLVDSADLMLGGSAAIVSCGLARLGVPTALAAVVGDDYFGNFVVREMNRAGVDTRWIQTDPTTPTGLSVVLSAGDRAILTYPGTVATTTADVVDPKLLRAVRHVHSASYFLQPLLAPRLPDMYARARAEGVTTSVDTNWDPTGRWEGVSPLLSHTDLLFPNTAELLALSAASDISTAGARLVRIGCRVALKNGAEGGVLWDSREDITRVPAASATVLDTTGAGDNFDAGFLSAFLEGLGSRECLQRAVRCGTLSTRGVGGTATQARRGDL